jgi:hypothetical protein
MVYDSKQRTGSSGSQGLATWVPTDPDPETKPRRGSDHQDQWDVLLEGRQQPDNSRGGQVWGYILRSVQSYYTISINSSLEAPIPA